MSTLARIHDLLAQLARRSEAEAAKLSPLFDAEIEKELSASMELGRAHSESWIGFHARCYIRSFTPRGPSDRFDSQSSGLSFVDTTSGDWVQYGANDVVQAWLDRAGTTLDKLERLEIVRKDVVKNLRVIRAQSLTALRMLGDDFDVVEVIGRIEKRAIAAEPHELEAQLRPKQFLTRDQLAASTGIVTPVHVRMALGPTAARVATQACINLADDLREARSILEVSSLLSEEGAMTKTNDSKTIFIGHGRSFVWRDLKDFLVERLGLQYIEFNSDPAAGLATKERLQEMVDAAGFAFLVLTAEDEQTDGSYRARENVVHEAGLFQGKLGFRRAILLVEEGCAEFSNIVGLTQIRFPKGGIAAKSEEIRRVLEREGILPR
jgi:predicted nucleotide-binding protein